MYRITIEKHGKDGAWEKACDPLLAKGLSLHALNPAGDGFRSVHLAVNDEDIAMMLCHDSTTRKVALIALPVLLKAEQLNITGSYMAPFEEIDAEALILGTPTAAQGPENAKRGFLDALRKALRRK